MIADGSFVTDFIRELDLMSSRLDADDESSRKWTVRCASARGEDFELIIVEDIYAISVCKGLAEYRLEKISDTSRSRSAGILRRILTNEFRIRLFSKKWFAWARFYVKTGNRWDRLYSAFSFSPSTQTECFDITARAIHRESVK